MEQSHSTTQPQASLPSGASIDSVKSVDPFAALLFFMAFLAALFFKR